MGSRPGSDRVRDLWQVGIRQAVLSRAGEGRTGAAQAAVYLLVGHGWASKTWNTCSSQVKTWLLFCDEEDRDQLPVTEGGVLAYLWYLFLEGRIGPSSVRQYVSAVSRFHVLQGLESPTRTLPVRAMIQAYISKTESDRPTQSTRIGLSTDIVRKIGACGLGSGSWRMWVLAAWWFLRLFSNVGPFQLHTRLRLTVL